MWLIHRSPHILNLGGIWRRVVSFMYQTVFCPGKWHASHLIVDCVGLRARLGTSMDWGGGGGPFSLPAGNRTTNPRSLVPRLVIIPTEIHPLIVYIFPPLPLHIYIPSSNSSLVFRLWPPDWVSPLYEYNTTSKKRKL
jgi:hypothetical protein